MKRIFGLAGIGALWKLPGPSIPAESAMNSRRFIADSHSISNRFASRQNFREKSRSNPSRRKSLEQIKATYAILDYDPLYSTRSSTATYIDAIYSDLRCAAKE